MLTDTHCHLAAPELFFRLPDILAAAAEAGVKHFIVPSASPTDWPHIVEVSAISAVRSVAFGIHPWFSATCSLNDDLHRLDTLLSRHPTVLVGEIGLDFHPKHISAVSREQQTAVFIAQLSLAKQYRRPIILHSLKSTDAVIRSIRTTGFDCGGFAHAFSGSLEEAFLLIRHGFCIGIGNLLTNLKAKKIRHAAVGLPLEHLVLETDSPYGMLKNTNTPDRLIKIAVTAAELRGITQEQLAIQCEKNICRVLSSPSQF